MVKFNFDWNYVSAGAPYVTISELGFAFNNPAISILGNPKKVILGFDQEKMAIGIKEFEGEPGVKPYDFANRIRNGWIRIGCKDFVKNLSSISGISFAPAIKYLASFDRDDKVLYISIKCDEEATEN